MCLLVDWTWLKKKISELQYMRSPILESKENKTGKTTIQKEQTMQGQWYNYKRYNINIMGIPER